MSGLTFLSFDQAANADLFSAQWRQQATAAFNARSRALSKLPHSELGIRLPFIFSIIILLGSLYASIHFAAFGLNTPIGAIVGSVIGMIIGITLLTCALKRRGENVEKNKSNSSQREQIVKASKHEERNILFQAAKTEIPPLLKKGEYFVITTSSRAYVFLPNQISQARKPYIEMRHDQDNPLTQERVKQAIRSELPEYMTQSIIFPIHDKLLHRKEHPAPAVPQMEMRRYQAHEGQIEITLPSEVHNYMPGCTTKLYSQQALSAFASLLGQDPREFHLNFDCHLATNNQALSLLKELLAMARQSEHAEIPSFLEDTLATQITRENVASIFLVAREFKLKNLEVACFYPLLGMFVSNKDGFYGNRYEGEREAMQECRERPLKAPAQLDIDKMSEEQKGVRNVYYGDLFKFTKVTQIKVVNHFSQTKLILSALKDQLPKLAHISVQSQKTDQPTKDTIIELLVLCQQNLPSMQVIEFVNAESNAALSEFAEMHNMMPHSGTELFRVLENYEELVILSRHVDRDSVFKKYHIEPTIKQTD